MKRNRKNLENKQNSWHCSNIVHPLKLEKKMGFDFDLTFLAFGLHSNAWMVLKKIEFSKKKNL